MRQQENAKQPALKPLFDMLEKVTNVVITIALLMVLVVVMVQIVGRLLNKPVPWTEEMSRYAFIWMMFIGIAVSMRRSEAARVTVFVEMLPKAGKVFVKYLYLIISIAFFVFMIITGCQMVGQQISMNEQGTAVLMPMWLIGVSVPVSGVLGILCTLGNLIMDPAILEGGQ